MEGKLIHVSGLRQDLFPSDGGHITVENVSYVEGIEANIYLLCCVIERVSYCK